MTALANETRPLIISTILFVGFFIGVLWLIAELAGWVFVVLKATR
jgi:hypothetical protein